MDIKMAELEISPNKGSDEMYDVCCSVCAEDNINTDARFCCQKCSKYFCVNCVLMHNKMLKDHSLSVKAECQNWSMTKTEDACIDLCEEHTTEKLKMFCEVHEKLLCQLCLFHNHRHCSSVVLLSDKVNTLTADFSLNQTEKHISLLQKELDQMTHIREQTIHSLKTFRGKVLQDINDLRQRFNDNLDRIQQNTVKELETVHSNLQTSLQNDIKKCQETCEKLKVIQDDITGIPQTRSERAFIAYRKCLANKIVTDSMLQEMAMNVGVEIALQSTNALDKLLCNCNELGTILTNVKHSKILTDPNETFILQAKEEFNVGTNNDQFQCTISGIVETSNEEIVIADWENKCLKLLDRVYTVIAHLALSARPWSMCSISSNEVAVTVCNRSTINEICFISVDNGRLTKIKCLALNHSCYGLAHHQGVLYLTTDTALYQYNLNGQLVKSYEDANKTFSGVAVSPDGKRLYILGDDKLLTLSCGGKELDTLQDWAFKHSRIMSNIHVAAKGKVFVFGDKSVSQVDTDGKKILKTLRDGNLKSIRSVCLSHDARTLFVGMWKNSSIMVYKTG